MAAKHSNKARAMRAKRARTRANFVRSAREGAADHADLSSGCETAINDERRNLQQAEALLGCVAVALEYGCDSENPRQVDYSDAVSAVRAMVIAATTQLDPDNLLQRSAALAKKNNE